MRFDGHRYRDCRWCAGRGCVYCEGEADKAYRSAFPEGPKPLATFKFDNPDDMSALRSIFGADALKRTFGPDGGGLREIEEKLSARSNRGEEDNG